MKFKAKPFFSQETTDPKLQARPPTPPGVSHKKAEVKVEDKI